MTPWVVGLVGTIQASCALAMALCWQQEFLSGIPIWAAHYSYKSGGHKQCIGPTCQCKINMVPGLDTENHPRTLLYQIETCRDWLNISAIILLTLSPARRLSSQFEICQHFWASNTANTNQWVTDFISFKCENNDVSSPVIISLSTLSQNKLNLPQILEIINFLPSLLHWSDPDRSEIAMF